MLPIQSHRPRVALLALPPLALIVLVGGLALSTHTLQINEGGWVTHTLEVLARVEKVRADVSEVRFHERNVALGLETDSRRHDESRAAVDQDLDELRRLTADNPVQRSVLLSLGPVWETFARDSSRIANLRPNSPQAMAEVKRRSHVGDLGKVSSLIASMREEEDGLLAERRARLQNTIQTNDRCTFLAAIAMVLGLGAIVLLLRREERHRQVAESAIERSRIRFQNLSEAAFEGLAVSQDGRIVDSNTAFLTMSGYPSIETLRGTPAENLAAPESRDLVISKRAAQDQNPYEAILLRADGTTYPAELRGRTIEIDGRPARVTAVRDLTAQKAAERVVQESANRLAEAQRVARMGSWSWDVAKGEILWSDELFRIFGINPRDGVPSLEELMSLHHPDDAATLQGAIDLCIAEGRAYEIDLRILEPDGGYRWTRAVGQGERSTSGVIDRLFGTLMDIHDRKILDEELRQRAEALRASEAALRAILRAAPVILFATDTEGTITLSKGAGLTALGLEPGEAVGHSVFDYNPNPDSVTALKLALDGETISFEAWHGDVCLHQQVRPLTDDRGELVGIIGVAFDVTIRRKAEFALSRSEERFRTMFESSSDAHLIFDETGIVDCNRAAVELLRCSDADELRAVHPATLSPEFQPDGRRSDEKCIEMDGLAEKKGHHRFEWTHRKMDGEEFPVEVTLTRVTLEGRPALLTVWHDLTEIKQFAAQLRNQRDELASANDTLETQRYALNIANERLESLATMDGLTGLKNQRTFRERLSEECAEAWRLNRQLSLLVLDVDHFKQYNDAFGHLAGDEALRVVAEVLREQAREYDIAARNGGEEFALLLPGTDEAGALAVAERVRIAVENRPWTLRSVTVSLGLASLLRSYQEPKEFMEAADSALYEAKRLGRNRVVISEPIAPPENGSLPYPVPENEAARLAALYASGIYRSEPDESYENLVAEAARAMDVPIALVSLVGAEEQWFKARVGLEATCTGRDVSFCAHAMLEDRTMVIRDATQDPRFADNPLVTGDLGLRFYAGAPILTRDGLPLGSLCAIDTVPRDPTPDQLHMLERLARQVARMIEAERQPA